MTREGVGSEEGKKIKWKRKKNKNYLYTVKNKLRKEIFFVFLLINIIFFGCIIKMSYMHHAKKSIFEVKKKHKKIAVHYYINTKKINIFFI
jgi:hypothetical protein